jgi:putative DNA primase/helicase
MITGADWPEPFLPLAAKMEPEPYPVDALPSTIRAAVKEVAGFVKAPIPLVAECALSAVSLAVQVHIDVSRAAKLQGPSGLFMLSIADSGERKTTCDGFFTKAIRDYEAEQAELAAPLLKEHAAKIAAWSAEREGILAAIKDAGKRGKSSDDLKDRLARLEHEKPQSPRVPRLILGDETPENMAWTLAKNWPSGGVISSEAGVVFGSHGMGKDSVMRNLALLNILWDGGQLSIGRRTSESFTVKGARLTVGLQIQEAALREFFARSGGLARGTGFLARFLVAWPESTQGYRPFSEAPETWPRLAAFYRRIAEILKQPAPIDDEGRLSPALLSLSPDAKAAWIAFHDAIERELKSGGELSDVKDVASKTADNAARLAALFQVFEHGTSAAVGLEAFESASRIAAWHLSESRRFFGELAYPVELANAVKLESWLTEHCRLNGGAAVPKNLIRQSGPGCVRDKLKLEAALEELAELNRARQMRDGKQYRVEVNPALLGAT